jgi:hypothetical protein
MTTIPVFLHWSHSFSFCDLTTSSPGPDFGSQPSISRRNLTSILHESGKKCSLIDSASVLERYSDASCNSIAVFSDDDALSRSMKEVGTTHF